MYNHNGKLNQKSYHFEVNFKFNLFLNYIIQTQNKHIYVYIKFLSLQLKKMDPKTTKL